jgi:hypothetical protein
MVTQKKKKKNTIHLPFIQTNNTHQVRPKSTTFITIQKVKESTSLPLGMVNTSIFPSKKIFLFPMALFWTMLRITAR